MEHFLEGICNCLEGILGNVPFGICLLVCALWGVLSVLFCPCHLASIPMIISYLKEQKNITIKNACELSLSFSFGIFLVICAIGLVTIGLGKVLEEAGSVLDWIIGLVFIVVGFHITGLIKYHHHDSCHEEDHDEHCGAPEIKYSKKGLIGAFIFGLIFGVLLSPCTFAYMAPVMGVALKKAIDSQNEAFLMFVFYGIGNVAIISLAGIFSEYISKYNHWSHGSNGNKVIKIICGIIIILAGIHLFFE